jgi:hypothetical protein
MSSKQIFKVIFHNQGKVYEIYAQNVDHGIMFGFIEVEKLIFGERSSVVVDPTEESLKNEFENVERTYIPLHSIIRIDEVQKEGVAKITEGHDSGSNVMPFPVYTKSVDSD